MALSLTLSEPIFDGGRIRSNYLLSQAQRQEMLLEYRKTILNALKDVSNSLLAYEETRERREEQAALVVSGYGRGAACKASLFRRQHKLSCGFDHNTDLYDVQLQLAQTQEQQAISLVQVYAAWVEDGSRRFAPAMNPRSIQGVSN
jgi:multidrug efflux system outer membrane protein